MAVPNLYQAAANAFQGAGGALNNAQNIYGQNTLPGNAAAYNPFMASAYTYNPALGQASTYNAANTSGVGYNPAQMQAANAGNADLISGGINRYMNPYTGLVIDNTARDIQRGANVQTQANNAAAVNAGAFGGGRHGLVDAVTNSEAQQNIGDVSAQLRAQGFDTAAGLSSQDVANKMNMGQFNANLLQQARSQNQGATNQALEFGAGTRMQANIANQNAQNTAGQYNAGNRQAMTTTNVGAQNASGQYNAGNRQDNSQYNAGARNTAGQWNAGAANSWDIAQSNEALSRAAGSTGNAGGYQNLGTTQHNIASGVGATQQQQGGLQQQLAQNIMNLAGGQFEGWQGQPQQALATLISALFGNPAQNASTTTGTSQYKPGALDWASLIGQTLGSMYPGGGGK